MSWMQCPKCGKNNLPNAKFCENCGQDLTAVQQNLIQPLPPKKSNAGKYILGVFIGLFLSLVAVGAGIVGHNYLAKRPVKSEHKLKTSTYTKEDQKKAQAESSSSGETGSSESEEASSTETESESTTEDPDSKVPSPLLAAGQTTAWTTNPAGSGDEQIIVIQGTDTVMMSHNTQTPSGTTMHNDGTFTIRSANSDGTSFTIMNNTAEVGKVEISGETLTLHQQGQTIVYHFKQYYTSDSSASETSAEGSSSDNFYEAD